MNKEKKLKGFTLIEVIIAMAIISIIAVAFFQILNNTIKMNEKTEKDIQMMDVAQIKMENILSDIREGSKKDGSIFVSINNSSMELNGLFSTGTKYISEEEYTYKDGMSKYNVKLEIYREKLGTGKILKDSYLYHIKYTVNEKNKLFSNREVNLETSISVVK